MISPPAAACCPRWCGGRRAARPLAAGRARARRRGGRGAGRGAAAGRPGRAGRAARRARRRSAGARRRRARRAHRRRGARSARPRGRHHAPPGRSRGGPAVAPGCARSPRPTPRVRGGRARAGPLAEALREWDAVGAGPPGAGRASFRLSEVRTLHDPADPGDDPDDQTGDGTHWLLEFLLQSTADPSLLVPAAQVWDGARRPAPRRPQELLLAELGRAARVYPTLAPALRAARPEALDLDADGAHQFLTAGAPLLDDAGFGVLLPSGGTARAGSGSRCRRAAPRPTACVAARRPRPRAARRFPLVGWPSATRRSARRRSPRSSRPRRRWSGCAGRG